AFEALSDATADTLFSAYQSHKTYFTARDKKMASSKEFRRAYSVPLRDFNTAGVVAAHLGCPLSQLDGGYHPVHGEDVQVNTERVRECETALDAVLKFI
ncbi:MAG: ParA family protein, partial [Candidatus Dormibacteria bacterium]